MPQKIHPLTKKKDFEIIFKNGKSIKNNFLIFKVLKNNLPMHRFGLVVSKKISNKAVVRNKVKRRLRRAIAYTLQQIDQSPSVVSGGFTDVIIIALQGIDKKEFSEIQQVVTGCFKKLSIR